ncbi:unnamed protein product [Adineta steineri]|uniref:Uncharacterized protein n=1 Tax=Adineta steineri TaxID=433720 RepID=A0A819SYB6_9BILA|nr:unnamed protein product [Adineta steineri]
MDRVLRNALNNHVIIVMIFLGLILQCIDVSGLAYYDRTGAVLVRRAAVGPQALMMTRPQAGPTAAIATIAQ